MTPSLGRLVTERLELVPWSEHDTEALVAIDTDPEVMRFIGAGATLDRAGSEALSRRIAAHWSRFGFGLWAVRPRSGASAGGTIGFTGLSHPLWLPGEEDSVEVGWRLARDSWGQGYAAEAARAAVDAAFGPLDLPRVISLIQPANVRSQRVAARLGMCLERAVVQPDTYHDLLVWALTRSGRPRGRPECDVKLSPAPTGSPVLPDQAPAGGAVRSAEPGDGPARCRPVRAR